MVAESRQAPSPAAVLAFTLGLPLPPGPDDAGEEKFSPSRSSAHKAEPRFFSRAAGGGTPALPVAAHADALVVSPAPGSSEPSGGAGAQYSRSGGERPRTPSSPAAGERPSLGRPLSGKPGLPNTIARGEAAWCRKADRPGSPRRRPQSAGVQGTPRQARPRSRPGTATLRWISTLREPDRTSEDMEEYMLQDVETLLPTAAAAVPALLDSLQPKATPRGSGRPLSPEAALLEALQQARPWSAASSSQRAGSPSQARPWSAASSSQRAGSPSQEDVRRISSDFLGHTTTEGSSFVSESEPAEGFKVHAGSTPFCSENRDQETQEVGHVMSGPALDVVAESPESGQEFRPPCVSSPPSRQSTPPSRQPRVGSVTTRRDPVIYRSPFAMIASAGNSAPLGQIRIEDDPRQRRAKDAPGKVAADRKRAAELISAMHNRWVIWESAIWSDEKKVTFQPPAEPANLASRLAARGVEALDKIAVSDIAATQKSKTEMGSGRKVCFQDQQQQQRKNRSA